jgi:hypothetical protein
MRGKAPGGVVYLVHFSEPYRHARHYTGWTVDLEARLAEHRAGRGARLLQVVAQAGIGWTLARTWEGNPAARAATQAPRRRIQALPDLPRRAEGRAMSGRADQIAALYAQQARVVQRQVARRVNAPTAVIEDACQTAWERLCTHPAVEPVAPSAVKWLVVTAMREAWASVRSRPTRPTSPNRSATHPDRSSRRSRTSTATSCATSCAG